MSVTGNELLALGLPDGPHFAAALAEANRLHLQGAALETLVRAMMPSQSHDRVLRPRDEERG